MIATASPWHWLLRSRADRADTKPPRPRPAPVFIGDAVQPWGDGTMLLAQLRAQSDSSADGQ
ncbi:hypothetical protein [Sulfitobacter sabulilitoris]|uniref:Uncharacterized protein n=1 Tax=Sulfitobacter sabulilitoris TaxID=2562655 RepID=A0A5S3PFG6_9RHOB|nr:hypothetical protein [Sulfitobacter sabulilitoris]TMM52787.1 hypothetical protein FDT80_11045 [Sulfitobacter sabulilitoris]